MATESPIWPAQLDHLRLNTPDPATLARFYGDALGFESLALPDDTLLLHAPGRRLVIGRGRAGERPYHGFRVGDRTQLDQIRRFLDSRGLALEASASSVFEPDAVAVRDPDGWTSIFGVPRQDLPTAQPGNDSPAGSMPARLQHVVVATDNLPAMMEFYENSLGFVPSDYCAEDPEDPKTRRVAFYRSDPEHHSLAIFAASEARADHHAYETTCWNDIRDWADHLASREIRIWWGPGRHGPGNNLFLMIQDPDGFAVELSAELEHLPRSVSARTWPHDERATNLWGPGWIRD
jgi:catechol 2,3-dioxygenase-like lactoylglutathione lyase family enzyme